MNTLKNILNGLLSLAGVPVEFNIGQIENSELFNTKQLPLLLLEVEEIEWEMDAYRRFANNVELVITVCCNTTNELMDTLDALDKKLFEKPLVDGDFKTDRLEIKKLGGVENNGVVFYCEATFEISRIWLERNDKVSYTKKKVKQNIQGI